MNLVGNWKNQLGSTVVLRTKDNNLLGGEYHTSVSSKGGPLPPTPLTGSYQETPNGILFGIIVHWHFQDQGEDKYSTTIWNGSWKKDNPDELITTWLLNSVESPEWKSVSINKDIFTRIE